MSAFYHCNVVSYFRSSYELSLKPTDFCTIPLPVFNLLKNVFNTYYVSIFLCAEVCHLKFKICWLVLKIKHEASSHIGGLTVPHICTFILHPSSNEDINTHIVYRFCFLFVVYLSKRSILFENRLKWASLTCSCCLSTKLSFVWRNVFWLCSCVIMLFQAADAGISPTRYREFARQQIDYMLGDSGRSYVVGFGHNYPKQPHHAAR